MRVGGARLWRAAGGGGKGRARAREGRPARVRPWRCPRNPLPTPPPPPSNHSLPPRLVRVVQAVPRGVPRHVSLQDTQQDRRQEAGQQQHGDDCVGDRKPVDLQVLRGCWRQRGVGSLTASRPLQRRRGRPLWARRGGQPPPPRPEAPCRHPPPTPPPTSGDSVSRASLCSLSPGRTLESRQVAEYENWTATGPTLSPVTGSSSAAAVSGRTAASTRTGPLAARSKCRWVLRKT